MNNINPWTAMQKPRIYTSCVFFLFFLLQHIELGGFTFWFIAK